MRGCCYGAEMLELRVATPAAWREVVLADFDAFLVDHAACERKASATGMAFVVRYPDRPELLDPLIAFAREELGHFHQVYRVLAERGLTLAKDKKDAYAAALLAEARHGPEQHLLDRLLVAAVIEARSCERLRVVAEALAGEPLGPFYDELARAEARHHGLFVRLAKQLYRDEVVRPRLGQILDVEADIVRALPLTAAVH
jgi:tRNA-(ms[2]io[6]A)-hydroxylase